MSACSAENSMSGTRLMSRSRTRGCCSSTRVRIRSPICGALKKKMRPSGLTVGYGDLVAKHPISRVLAVLIGFSGIFLTALLAAAGVRALQTAAEQGKQ